MRKTLALLIALVLVFGVAGTGLALNLDGGNTQAATQTATIQDSDQVTVSGGEVGNAEVENVFQINAVANLRGIQLNRGDQTNTIKATGGANISTGGNTIKQDIDQKIVPCCPKKPTKPTYMRVR